jgi:hypothetical protein
LFCFQICRISSAIEEGASVRVRDKNNHFVSGTVCRFKKGHIQVRTDTGHSLWIEATEVKHRIKLLTSSYDEDSSSSDSEEERKRVALAEVKTLFN